LELLIKHGSLRTPGELPGERKVSSDLPEETLAESATLPHIPTNDLQNIIISKIVDRLK